MEQKKYSVVIPVFNEQYRIGKTITQIGKVLKNFTYEILIIDDGSFDNTLLILNEIQKKDKTVKVIKLLKNYGKGFALKIGFLNAQGKYIIMTDADLSTPIDTIFELEHLMDDYDILVGSRILKPKKNDIQGPFSRRVLRSVSIALKSVLFDLKIKDTQCGFKIFKNKVAKNIAKKMTINRYGADIEKLIIAQKMGYKIKEVSVPWFFDAEHSKIVIFRDSFFTFFEWIKIKINLIRGFYSKCNLN